MTGLVFTRPADDSCYLPPQHKVRFMNGKHQISIGTLVLLIAPLALACDYPNRPSIPDGSSASKEELLAAKNDVSVYLTGVDEYLSCIENRAKADIAALENPEPAEVQRRDELMSKKFDAANDEKALVGEEFNLQVRAYNAARKASN